jgi:hypothetical protein
MTTTTIETTTTVQTETDSNCQLYQQFHKRIEYFIPACPVLAKEQYIKDMIDCVLNWLQHSKEIRVKLDNEHWYKPVPKLVETSHEGKVTVLRNQQVQTNRTTNNNKPDIIIRDNVNRAYMLTHVAISGGRNVIKKEAEKILKHKDLRTDIPYILESNPQFLATS